MSTRPTIVLFHGIRAGGSRFNKVTPALQALVIRG